MLDRRSSGADPVLGGRSKGNGPDRGSVVNSARRGARQALSRRAALTCPFSQTLTGTRTSCPPTAWVTFEATLAKRRSTGLPRRFQNTWIVLHERRSDSSAQPPSLVGVLVGSCHNCSAGASKGAKAPASFGQRSPLTSLQNRGLFSFAKELHARVLY